MKRLFFLFATSIVIGACASTQSGTLPAANKSVVTDAKAPTAGSHAQLALLETTDIHSNVFSYDFFKLADDPSLGLVRVATLIKQARNEFENSLTFDDGDTIQGTVLADYQAQVEPVSCDKELAVYKVMDAIGYDAGTIGNHEFNYGLQFLSQVTGTPFDVAGIRREQCVGPKYPFVLSNVISTKNGQPLFAPWKILTRKIKTHAADGSVHETSLHVGVIGFTPTWILDWDKRNLDGKVTVIGAVEAAQKYVPEIRQAGADIIVAICHCGIDTSAYSARQENPGWNLANVPGIDAVLLGHSHDIFPNPHDAKSRFNDRPEVDNQRGFVRGVPAVMGNFYGKSLGLIDLALVYREGRWQVDRAATHAEVRSIKNADGSAVTADGTLENLARDEFDHTVAYVKTPIGRTDYPINTYFVAAGETSALTLVNAAQRDYAQKYIKSNLPQFANHPLLSAASPFKAGFGGAGDYTDIAPGPLAIHSAADLYLYPNTLTVVKVNGAGVKAWLEYSANWFNQIDPAKREAQELVNNKFPTYNFDVLQGDLTYRINVTKPIGERIVDLRYRGRPLDPAQEFLVVTNNYRASGGGRFPGLDGSNIVFSAPDTNRDVLIAFIRAQGDIKRARFGNEYNWHFVHAKIAGPVEFKSAAGKLDLAKNAGLRGIAPVKDNADGTAVYSIDLSR